jgi:hypothetical protein
VAPSASAPLAHEPDDEDDMQLNSALALSRRLAEQHRRATAASAAAASAAGSPADQHARRQLGEGNTLGGSSESTAGMSEREKRLAALERRGL